MTLKTLINKVSAAALSTINVRTVIINDAYRINPIKDVQYGAVVILQRRHDIGDTVSTYRLTLAYVDRLTTDLSNELDIQSDGMLTLTNIVNALDNDDSIWVDRPLLFESFNQRFYSDECAGVMCDIELQAPTSLGECFTLVDSNNGFTYNFNINFKS